MNEFIEKLIGRLEEEAVEVYREREPHEQAYFGLIPTGDKDILLRKVKKIIDELAVEHKDKTIIDRQYCWQTCGATEHCKECNRLCNGSIDYYENCDFMATEPQWKQAMMNTFLKR